MYVCTSQSGPYRFRWYIIITLTSPSTREGVNPVVLLHSALVPWETYEITQWSWLQLYNPSLPLTLYSLHLQADGFRNIHWDWLLVNFLIMDGSKYVSDGKCDGSATKYVQPCASYSQRSLDCLMENDGDKDACGSKCIELWHCIISICHESELNICFCSVLQHFLKITRIAGREWQKIDSKLRSPLKLLPPPPTHQQSRSKLRWRIRCVEEKGSAWLCLCHLLFTEIEPSAALNQLTSLPAIQRNYYTNANVMSRSLLSLTRCIIGCFVIIPGENHTSRMSKGTHCNI